MGGDAVTAFVHVYAIAIGDDFRINSSGRSIQLDGLVYQPSPWVANVLPGAESIGGSPQQMSIELSGLRAEDRAAAGRYRDARRGWLLYPEP